MRPVADLRSPALELEPVPLPGTGRFDLTARDGSVYRILLSLPPEPVEPAGAPALILVDGHALFPLAVGAARLQRARPEVTGVGGGAIIGIGYPDDKPFDAERRARDLLPVAGGAERFLKTILDEILPAVEAFGALDRRRLALAGHSYGGLFALHSLFTRPEALAAVIAGSPSIWWQDRAIHADEARFRAGGGTGERLLITVGGAEQRAMDGEAPQRAERRLSNRMQDNAAEMAARLGCSFVEFAQENHVSVIPAMVSRAVAFGLSASPAEGRQAA